MKVVGGYHVKEYEGSTFVRVFHQSTVVNRGKKMLFEDRDIVFFNTFYKFSVLGSINERFKISGYYEFLINYPDGRKVHWQQTTNPLEYTTSTGMKPIDINESVFQGLRRVNNSDTCIKGTNYNGYWFFAIGTKRIYYEGIPGFCWGEGTGIAVKEVTLWMKITEENIIRTSLPRLEKCTHARRYCNRPITPFIYLLIIAL